MTNLIPDLLNMLRVQSTVYIGKNLSAPWGVHITEHPTLARFHIVVAGSTWVDANDDQEPVELHKGDVAIFFNGSAHSYMDAPGRYTTTASFPTGQENSYFETFDRDSVETHLLCGYFEMSPSTPPAVSENLPDMLIGRANETSQDKKGARTAQIARLIDLITDELVSTTDQSRVVLNRMTEILCMFTLRTWMTQTIGPHDHLFAMADSKTKAVLDMIHEHPYNDWTVDALAQLYGQSRTAFTAHFKRKIGISPMQYVRKWRINKACEMLEEDAMSIDEAAFKSGYADTNAFNRAFKRETGYSPGAYKRLILN
ncbi:MAG: AraC family transcriptional regulator [Pseudomonadota bacterium]